MSDLNYREIRVPPLGESISEATIARWLKNQGDTVLADEIIVELETDKVTLEVTAPTGGLIHIIHSKAGDTVYEGGVLGTIHLSADSHKSKPATLPTHAAQSHHSPHPQPERSDQSFSLPLNHTQNLSPAVLRIVEEYNLDPLIIPATGHGGRLIKEDVLHYIEHHLAARAPVIEMPLIVERAEETPIMPSPSHSSHHVRAAAVQELTHTSVHSHRRADDPCEERVKLSPLRRKIAQRLKEAQNTAAILTTFNEVDMTAINSYRALYKDKFEKKHGVKLGFMSFFVKASIQALKEFPALNAEIDGDDVIYKNFYDIGVAVSAPQGLVVPVVKGANAMNFSDIEKEIGNLGQRAKEGKLSRSDMEGGTFTISNGGIFGSLMSTPILNFPQTGILGMHKIQDRPIVVNGQIVSRPMMYLALSYDHRLIDGREAVSFLVRIKEYIENPERLLLGV